MTKLPDNKYYSWLNLKANLDNTELYQKIKNFIYSKYTNPIIYDLGCGQGFLTNYLNAVGFDKNKYAISLAQRNFPDKNFYNL